MTAFAASSRIDVYTTDHDLWRELADDVRHGLTRRPKSLPPKHFYDARGSALFDRITRLPEYYPTRTEREILTDRAAEIAELSGADTLVELGSGASEKSRLLLDALRANATLRRYVPVDVSESALRAATKELSDEYPGLAVHGVVADFDHHLSRLPTRGRRLVAFLGGTVGNLAPHRRHDFYAELRSALTEDDGLVLGVDLVKDPARLVAAYDDADGVTAEFNRNVLHVINRSLGADLDPSAFDHVAAWNATDEWIEMRLRARHAHQARIAGLDLTVDFTAGEEIRTEISAKFRRATVEDELSAAGFAPQAWWTDLGGDFALAFATPTR